ncbi:MAG: tRNA (adenosine(37)-N6)-threonylcarbamoyltransferase complex ATPase subunit type 1 TsaE [Oligosphaeraceae bacterium]
MTPHFFSDSDEKTLAMGMALAPSLEDGTVIALAGDLGCGKTVLSRGIARGLGIVEAVTSPTFTVAQEYRRPDGKFLYHLDMYRISDENDALAFGIDEFLFQPNAITLVEWPEQIAGLLDSPRRLTIRFQHLAEGQRALEFLNFPPHALRQAALAAGLTPLSSPPVH